MSNLVLQNKTNCGKSIVVSSFERYPRNKMTGDSSSGESPLPKRKSRLRHKSSSNKGATITASSSSNNTNRPRGGGGNVVPLTHFLPKNWLVLWGAGLFCLVTVTLLPILILESNLSLPSNGGNAAAPTSTHVSVHTLMENAAKTLRGRAIHMPWKRDNIGGSNNQVNNQVASDSTASLRKRPSVGGDTMKAKDNDEEKTKKKSPSGVTEKQFKPHYTLDDLTPDTTNWQEKPVARGLAGRPLELTPALVGARRAHIECDLPVDSLAYWNDPIGERDLNYETPYKPKLEPGRVQYITFTPDRGGWNNVRMSMEIIFVLAAATGRTLVLPPKEPLYLLVRCLIWPSPYLGSKFFFSR